MGWRLMTLPLVCAGLIVVVLFIWPGLVVAARNTLHRRKRGNGRSG